VKGSRGIYFHNGVDAGNAINMEMTRTSKKKRPCILCLRVRDAEAMPTNPRDARTTCATPRLRLQTGLKEELSGTAEGEKTSRSVKKCPRKSK
jgi:hypothetical protein